MQEVETIIVGGGPGGSSCAWWLRRHGRDCLVLDKARFPRPKLCGGWITPHVLADLEIALPDYPHGVLTFRRMHVHLPITTLRIRVEQHSIRRVQFDDWLLRRSGAPCVTHEVKHVAHAGRQYVIDDAYRCRFLVGAGGTGCPVYRALFRVQEPRARHLQITALEHEFPHPDPEPDCHLWFFRAGLPGYAWYVPKTNGYVNIGIGAMSAQLQGRTSGIHEHWRRFVTDLEACGLVRGVPLEPRGYSYFLRAPMQRVQRDAAYLVGDAAGLATWDLAEGIGPAIRSGLLVARSIVAGADCSIATVARYSASPAWLGWPLKHLFVDRSRRAAGLRR